MLKSLVTLTPLTVTPAGITCVSEKETSEFVLIEADAGATTIRLGESVGASFTAAIFTVTVAKSLLTVPSFTPNKTVRLDVSGVSEVLV